jgi:TolA-binding protein
LVSPDVCQDLLAQVNREERDYNAEVTRLQRIVATTKDPAEAARAQLWTGHAHQRAGVLEPAQQCYWKVVSSYPDRPEARSALFQVVDLHRLRGDPKSAVTVCKMAIDLAPDGDLAVRACEVMRWLGLMHEQAPHEETREHLRQIAGGHAGTRAADTARFYIGELYAGEGLSEEAEKEWAALLAERPNAQVAPEVRLRLADLRYTMGTRAFLEGDFARAAQLLERLLPDLDLIRHSTASGRSLDAAHPIVASKRRLAVFSLGEAYQKLGRWEEAADAFERLAVPGNPAEEIALFQLCRSKMEAGHRADAIAALTKLRDRFPQSPYIARCEDYIRTIQGER